MVKLLPKKLRLKLRKVRGIAHHVGWSTALRYYALPKNTVIDAEIGNTKLKVRAGSPDIDVAIDCITSEYAFLPEYFGKHTPAVIIDAGAYIGTAALVFANNFPDAKIVCIEPSSENLKMLAMNVSGRPNISIIPAALTAAPLGNLTLKNRGTGQWGFTVVQAPQDATEASEIEAVKTVAVDDLISELGGKVDFLKLDVEGAEKSLFERASPILKSVSYIFVELHDHIAPGCRDAFTHFSSERDIVTFSGEKYLSIRK